MPKWDSADTSEKGSLGPHVQGGFRGASPERSLLLFANGHKLFLGVGYWQNRLRGPVEFSFLKKVT